MFALGDTWDREKKQHTCCGSKHSYHASACRFRNLGIPGRSSDPDFIKVQQCKLEGISSGECAKRNGMPLGQVNELWTT